MIPLLSAHICARSMGVGLDSGSGSGSGAMAVMVGMIAFLSLLKARATFALGNFEQKLIYIYHR